MLKRTVSIDDVSPLEQRMSWDAHGSAGSSSSTRLRSGLTLSATHLRWDQPWAFRLRDTATPLKFLLGRGVGPRMTPGTAPSYVLGEGVLQVRRATEPVSTLCEFTRGGAEFEQLALEVEPHRLRELLGTQTLPRAVDRLLTGSPTDDMHEQPMTPALARLVEEILHAGSRGPSRQLYLEAKGLELLAVLVDELELVSQAMAPLGPRDVERLESARRLLLQRMAAPPSLPELARLVGLNEVKLKQGFRTLFGMSVFAHLRSERMELARRLLVQRHLSVSEIAARVGYANPSKFASAFRKHFGFSPSALR